MRSLSAIEVIHDQRAVFAEPEAESAGGGRVPKRELSLLHTAPGPILVI
jgi:hypothetical protein